MKVAQTDNNIMLYLGPWWFLLFAPEVLVENPGLCC